MKRFLPLVSLLAALCPLPVYAAEQTELGTFDSWSAHSYQEPSGTVCYMVAEPDKKEGKYGKRGDVLAMITHRPAEGTRNVFSYMAGYSYKKGSEVELSIDGKKYRLFTQNDMAWAADATADTNIADAIKKGSKMVVSGVSAKGTPTKDTFSLKGSTKAFEEISKACNQ